MHNSFVIRTLAIAALFSISVPCALAKHDHHDNGHGNSHNSSHSSSHTVVRTNNNGRVTVVDQYSSNGKGRGNAYAYGHSKNGNAYGHYKNKHKYKNRDRDNRTIVINNNGWNWERHNWNEQRQYMHDNWRARRARMNALQQQQLDAQLRAQWLAYKNNSYNGPYNWDMYSDPMFLDYVHMRNPSLLTTIRSILGF